MNKVLSKLQKIELREVWNHEAFDFTNWLALEENLEILSEEIGVPIRLVKTEANVGKFNVDILAEEEVSGRKIIIENQLEDTNHDHLGKIITYASGYDAEIIIWIVKNVREEHQKAIEWLNDHSDETINFFLLKIELWRIENSNPAPKFEIMVSPNEWAKTVKASHSTRELTDTKLQQLEFWTKFKDYVHKINPQLKLRTPRPQHWYTVSIGSSEAHLALTVNTRENIIAIDLYIVKDKDFYESINLREDKIKEQLGEELNWWNAEKASGLRIKKQVKDVFAESTLESSFQWLYERTLLMQKVFGKYLRDYKRR